MKNLTRLPVLFKAFFKISAVTIGGGMTMIPVMEREFVEKRKWLTNEDMVDTVAVIQSMPGVIAVNMAIMIGYRVAGVAGTLVSVSGVLIPPFFAILLIASFFKTLSGNEAMGHIFRGVRASVCALILLSAVKMGKVILKAPFAWIVTVFAFLIFTFCPDINAVWVIIASGAAGVLFSLWKGGDSK